jgi:hypothetical protein
MYSALIVENLFNVSRNIRREEHKLGGETPSQIRAWSLICNEKFIVLFEKTTMRLRSQRLLHMQGYAGHLCSQGGGQEKNNR